MDCSLVVLFEEYVDAVLKAFENTERTQMQVWARMFTPKYVADVWVNQF